MSALYGCIACDDILFCFIGLILASIATAAVVLSDFL